MTWEKFLTRLLDFGFTAFLLGQASIIAILGVPTVFVLKFASEILGLVREEIKKPIVDWIVSKLQTLWLRLTSRFQSKYYKRLIEKYRCYRTQGLKDEGRPLQFERVFVPLQIAQPEGLDKLSSGIIQANSSAEGLRIWNFLASQQPKDYKPIALLGPPGSGKTTLLEHLTLTYAQNTQRQQLRNAPSLIPMLLYLREVREVIAGKQPPNLAKLLEQQEWIQKLNPPPNWFEHKLTQGKCLVMLDGLDEMADETQHQRVSRWVDQQMQDYPDAIFILTSRPCGYPRTSVQQKYAVVVEGFNLKQIQQFIHKWYLQHEITPPLGKDDPSVREVAKKQANDLINRIRNNPPLAEMAPNPLLLTMIATVHRFRSALPKRRVELYTEICDMLLGQRREAKGIPDTLLAAQKKFVLQVLALELMQRRRLEFTLEMGSSWIRERLATVARSEVAPAQFLRHVENVSGLLVKNERGRYEFVHKSFQEYLAATQIKESNQEHLLTRSIEDSWWEETIRLYAAQSDATELIQAALDATNLTQADQEKPNVDALSLAYNCLKEGLGVQLEVRRRLEDMVEIGLKSTRSDSSELVTRVKLSQRQNELLWVNENVAIDTAYITCAEYQLFIDQRQEADRYYSPAHWQTDRFLAEDATRPVTGVQAGDAEKFCEWLTQEYPKPGFKCRLPSLIEASLIEEEERPAIEKQIGCWCNTEENKVVAGIEPAQWQAWRESLAHALARDLDQTLDYILTRDLDQTLDYILTGDLDQTLAHILASSLEHVRNFAQAQALDEAFDHIHTCARRLDQAQAQAFDYTHTCARFLNEALGQARALVQVPGQACPPDQVFIGVLARALDHILAGARTDARNSAQAQAIEQALVHILACRPALDFAHAQAQALVHTLVHEHIDPLARAIDLNRIYTPAYALAYARIHILIHDFLRDRAPDPVHTRSYLLLICILWDFLSNGLEAISRNRRLPQSKKLTRQQCEALRHEYVEKRNDTLNLYAIFVLTNERRNRQMPAWEGIRIVRERVQQ